MTSGRLLVVAPENDLRRSLVFALQADGFTVVSRSAAPAGPASDLGELDCTVLDEKAASEIGEAMLTAFCREFAPVVLLSTVRSANMAAGVAAIVDKPLRGQELSQAIQAAIMRQSLGDIT